jgi:hypothetical protein
VGFVGRLLAVERPDPVETARSLVSERFPDALGAWLGGSSVTDRVTDTSDLDVTVLLAYADVHRESLEHRGWPVELFVHDTDSVRHFVERDAVRRRPTMARMVSRGVPLVESKEARALATECAERLSRGPGPLPIADLDAARYALTDLVDDLVGGGTTGEVVGTAVATWQATGELVLDLHRRWRGTAKWLVRELETLDDDLGTAYAERLVEALRCAMADGTGPLDAGDTAPLVAIAEETLAMAGGRLWEGYHAIAVVPGR